MMVEYIYNDKQPIIDFLSRIGTDSISLFFKRKYGKLLESEIWPVIITTYNGIYWEEKDIPKKYRLK